MGSRREAWCAGCNPKNKPTAVAVPRPLTTDRPEMRNSQPVNRQIIQVAARLSAIPSSPPATVSRMDSRRNWL